MLGRALFVLFSLTLVACAPARRRWQPREIVGAASAAFVVVPMSAALHTAPSRRAPAARLASPSGARTPWVGSRLAVFRIVGERGGWAELESTGPVGEGDDTNGPHCAEIPSALRPFRLRFFVPSRAMVPVTAREVVQTFGDDTSVALARGVPVEALPGTRLFRARLGSLSAVVRLGVADTGSRYLPSEDTATSDAPLGYLGPSPAGEAPILGQTGRVTVDSPQLVLPYYSVRPRGQDERIVELRPSCATLFVRVAAARVEAPVGALLGRLVSEEGGAVAVEAGAEVFWTDGRPAGMTAERVALSDELPRHEALRCFAYRLRAGTDEADAKLGLCFHERDVLAPGAGLGARLDRP